MIHVIKCRRTANVFGRTAPNFKIYYKSASTGFSTPSWNGYPAFPCYILDYDGNGNTGGNAPSSAPYPENTAATVSANSGNLQKTGYVFGGWNLKEDGTGLNYEAGTGTFNITADTTLYAKWMIPYVVGVAFERGLPEAFAGASKIKVKGLPAGLKYDVITKLINGIPSKPGMFTVEISAAEIPSQYQIFSGAALPQWVQGAFDGAAYIDLINDSLAWENHPGTASMNISSLGEITGKISCGGKSCKFSKACFSQSEEDGVFKFEAVAKFGTRAVPLSFTISQPLSDTEVETMSSSLKAVAHGSYDGTDLKCEIPMYRNVWKDSGMETVLDPYIGYYTAVLPGNARYGSGYFAFTVDKNGKIKMAGKLADGVTVSQNGALVMDEKDRLLTVIYASPAAYQAGCLFGLAEFIKKDDSPVFLRLLEDEQFIWRSRNPKATSVYNEGFDRRLELVGGWYDKIGNLYDYYSGMTLTTDENPGAPSPAITVSGNRHISDWWNFSDIVLTPMLNKSDRMIGHTAPEACLPVKIGDSWDYTNGNTVALNIGLTRATGVFKGSFKAWFDYGKTHTSKRISYEGVLTPEREAKDDGIEGRGFFLWADKVQDPLGKTYPFNWSYDFLILGDGE